MNPRFLAVAASVVLIGGIVPTSVAARSPDPLDRQTFDVSRLRGGNARAEVTVVLELAGTPIALHESAALARGARLSSAQKAALRAPLVDQQRTVASAARALGGRVEGDYQDAYNGVRVRIAARQLAALARTQGVVKVHRLQTHEYENINTLRHLGVPATWQATGRTGNGVKVAIIDTGVDYHHAHFGGTGAAAYTGDPGDNPGDGNADNDEFPTAKVIGGYDFVGDAYDANCDPTADPTCSPTPQPDPDPLDCNGHGTHVAGTAAGSGVTLAGATYTGSYNGNTLNATNFAIGPGMAPRAKILAYRVFGCVGSTNVVLDALERAYEDGADVVNMSLGSPFGRPDTPEAVASNNISAAGVTVIASAGNSGPSAYITGSPSSAKRVLSVAAMDAIPSIPLVTIDLPDLADLEGQNSNNYPGPWPITGELEVLKTPTGGVAEGCAEGDYSGTAGKIVVTKRGTCARVDRAIFGDRAGAKAVIMINTGPGYPPFEGPITGVDIPFIGTKPESEEPLLASDGKTVTVNQKLCGGTPCPNPGYKQRAGFTSGGPGRIQDFLKPNVIAPGVGVVSAFVGTGNGALQISGTSMSSPAVAGIAALVTEAHPTWSPVAINSAIVSTATTSTAKILGYDMRLAGAGVVDPLRAVRTVAFMTTRETIHAVTYGYDQLVTGGRQETKELVIENRSASSITYNLSSSFNGPGRGAVVTFSPATITVPPNSGKAFLATFSLSAAAARALPAATASDTIIDAAGRRTSLAHIIRGFVTATPTTARAGEYAIRMPFIAVPRATSDVVHAARTPYTVSGENALSSTKLTNYGVHRGTADVYAWGLTDGREGYESSDIRAVGVKSVDNSSSGFCNSRLQTPAPEGGFPAGDRCLVFAVNTWGRWSNPSVNEFDVSIDTEDCFPAEVPEVCANDDPEVVLVGVDAGAITTGTFDGSYGVFLFERDTATGAFALNEDFFYLASAPANSSTMLLPVHASLLGLEAGGDTDFEYLTESFQIFDGSPGEGYDLATTGLEAGRKMAVFDAFDPAISQGQNLILEPGESETLLLAADRADYEPGVMKGWMVVTLDDRNGLFQAETIPSGTVPAP